MFIQVMNHARYIASHINQTLISLLDIYFQSHSEGLHK